MTRAIGIDPGTVSFDVCGRDGDDVFLDATFATAEVGADPARFVESLRSVGAVDIVVGPSGYGLPWVAVEDLGPREVGLMLLGDAPGVSTGVRGEPLGTIVEGMGEILLALKRSGLPLCLSPGVIHLATVPAHRKVNRIDMGTADKLCAVALGIWDQAHRRRVPYDEVSLVFVELGGAFTAVVAVEGGRVVDGSGGTSGAMGFQALGAMDGELAYLMGGFSKGNLATGGMAWIAGTPDRSPEEVVAAVATDPRAARAMEALLEDVVKRVAGMVAVVAQPREIVLSGRLSHLPRLATELSRRLTAFAPVRVVEGFASVAGEAAQGAALVGQGLTGDASLAQLVETMGLRGAEGTVLDHVFVGEAEALRRRYRTSEPAPPPFWQRS